MMNVYEQGRCGWAILGGKVVKAVTAEDRVRYSTTSEGPVRQRAGVQEMLYPPATQVDGAGQTTLALITSPMVDFLTAAPQRLYRSRLPERRAATLTREDQLAA